MKKIIGSKGFVITCLFVLCFMVIGICFFTGRDRGTEFVPEPSGVQAEADMPLPENPALEETEETVWETVSETEEETETEGTEILQDIAEEPETPAPEKKKEETVAAPVQEPTSVQEPSPGQGPEGAVYDEVFGWVYPSRAVSVPGDSSGDPDKMVGNM